MSKQVVRCPVCGQPYEFYMHYAGDQSVCPPCKRKAKENR